MSIIKERKYFYHLDNNNYMSSYSAILVNGVWCVEYTNETLEDYKAHHPDQNFSQLYPWEEFEVILSDYDKKRLIDPPAKEVDESRYWDMLYVLPPCRWHHCRGIELFHLSERITGNIVSWIAGLNGKYYEFAHYENASDEELAAKVLEAAN